MWRVLVGVSEGREMEESSSSLWVAVADRCFFIVVLVCFWCSCRCSDLRESP